MTEQACLELARTRVSALAGAGNVSEMFNSMPLPGAFSSEYVLPPDSGRKVALARGLLHQLGSRSDILIWLRNWNVWPSSAHQPLMVRLRHALGCDAPLEQAPGHLAAPDELDDALSLTIVALEFVWDCFILEIATGHMFFISHDEFLLVMSADSTFLEATQAKLTQLGIRAVPRERRPPTG